LSLRHALALAPWATIHRASQLTRILHLHLRPRQAISAGWETTHRSSHLTWFLVPVARTPIQHPPLLQARVGQAASPTLYAESSLSERPQLAMLSRLVTWATAVLWGLVKIPVTAALKPTCKCNTNITQYQLLHKYPAVLTTVGLLAAATQVPTTVLQRLAAVPMFLRDIHFPKIRPYSRPSQVAKILVSGSFAAQLGLETWGR